MTVFARGVAGATVVIGFGEQPAIQIASGTRQIRNRMLGTAIALSLLVFLRVSKAMHDSDYDPTTNGGKRSVAAVQGIYFLVAGVWPILNIDSFQAVTGSKTDLWLVYTVGGLVSVIGLAILLAATSARVTRETMTLAIGSAIVLAAIDVIFALRGTIWSIYLLDAAAELALLGWWTAATIRSRRQARAARRQFPHLQALLARGQSVQLAEGKTK